MRRIARKSILRDALLAERRYRLSGSRWELCKAIAVEYQVDAYQLLLTAREFRNVECDAVREREAAKRQARELTGLNVARINQWEDSGHDYGSWPGLDETAFMAARDLPDLGLAHLQPHTDFACLVWRILREGRVFQPRRDDRRIIVAAAEYMVNEPETAASVPEEF